MKVPKNWICLIESLHVSVLMSFAIAQPIYDLLGRSPEFFIAHLSQPSEIVALVGSLSLLVPGVSEYYGGSPGCASLLLAFVNGCFSLR